MINYLRKATKDEIGKLGAKTIETLITKEDVQKITDFVMDLDMLTGIDTDERGYIETAVLEGMKKGILKCIEVGYRLIPKLTVLNDEEINQAFDSDFGEVHFDHKPTPEEIMLIKLRLVATKALDQVKKELQGE